MIENYIRNVLEAALLAAGRPLQLTELAQLFDENARPEQADLRAAIDALAADYANRGIEVKETATGFRVQVKRELANEVSRLWPERPPRYSRALLETLALIAYRQPITRAEIEAVRGVAVNPNIIKTVIERNWVRVVGTRDVPGRPELLGTTREFLDYFGLRSLEELPPLAELKAMGEINLQLDLAKPGDSSGSQGGEGSGGEGSGGAAPPAEGSAPPADGSGSAVAAAGVAAVAAGAVAAVASSDGEATGESSEAPTASAANDSSELAAAESVNEASDTDAPPASDSARDDEADPGGASEETLVAQSGEAESAVVAASDAEAAAQSEDFAAPRIASLESDAKLASLDVEPPAIEAPELKAEGEAESGDVTVEVETLSLVEPEMSFESDEPAPRTETAIETGEFELAELGMGAKPTAEVIEAEFDAEDLDNAATDEESADDDEEELSAGPQSSTGLVAAPRDQDD